MILERSIIKSVKSNIMNTLVKAALMLGFTALIGNCKLAAQVNNSSDDSYSDAIGVRLGGTTGFSYKHRFNNPNAFEAILGTYPYSLGITALYERYFTTRTNGLSLYFGAGGHIARPYYNSWGFYYNDRYYFYRNAPGPVLGIDLIGGLEYKIPDVPLALSFDLKPNTEFYRNYSPLFSLDPGLGIKFTF
jgi:hypothetical protein